MVSKNQREQQPKRRSQDRTTVNRPRSITPSRRRSRSQMAEIRDAICACLEENKPMTIRQLFYQLVSMGTIDKTEQEYHGTVIRLTADMRRARMLPFGWIADNTRWMRKPRTYGSMEESLDHSAKTHRLALWDSQDVYVEIWLEKDALAGVLYEITGKWDVPLMVTRGYASLSFLAGAAEAIEDQDKPTHLYYFGDHDPSGKDIPRVVERDLRELAPDSDINFTQVAVTPEQIRRLSLPTRPTKQTDSRAGTFVGESVEVDAIPPATLRSLAAECIESHIDKDELERTLRVERGIRQTYEAIRDNLPAVKKFLKNRRA